MQALASQTLLGVLAVFVASAGCDGAASCGAGAGGSTARGTLSIDPALLVGDGTDVMDEAAIDVIVATEVELLTSTSLMERVVRRLALDRDPRFLGVDANDPSFEGASVGEAAERLADLSRASRREGTLLVDVSVSGEEPEMAAALCNAVIEAAIEMEIEATGAPRIQALEYLGGQLDELEEERDAQRDRLARYEPDDPSRAEAERSVAVAEATAARVRDQMVEVQLASTSSRAPLRLADRCVPTAP